MSMSFGRNTMLNAICSLTRQELSMANFYGSSFRSPYSHRVYEFSDEMHGTGAGDTFYAGGGNDTIYAGGGSDEVYGGSGDDTIYATAYGYPGFHAAWGNDAVYGGDGNDRIFYGDTTSNVILFGDNMTSPGAHDGNDTIVSGSGDDYIYGGGGNDRIWGGAGNDVIYGDMPFGSAKGDDLIVGGAGTDYIYGGAGNDQIWGGRDVDYLTGGSGADTFAFAAGDSGLHYADADVIYDFTPSFDRGFPGDVIDVGSKGTSSNFGHITIDTSHQFTWAAEYEHALSSANAAMQIHPTREYEFVTDGQDGWLFADTNGDHRVDTGIELRGVTDMHYWNVV
jgi:Ca2+-binding RTX toxin-like protein